MVNNTANNNKMNNCLSINLLNIKKRLWHMTVEIQVLALDRHKRGAGLIVIKYLTSLISNLYIFPLISLMTLSISTDCFWFCKLSVDVTSKLHDVTDKNNNVCFEGLNILNSITAPSIDVMLPLMLVIIPPLLERGLYCNHLVRPFTLS